ncbi:MAG: hypothetical protein COX90_01110 [Candidatus Nealsonbacteria bacterium CG_4_10_14_0_2_um_filter_38_17]|uniref:YgjP-like metallopeptidase domain-containing protein n=2 Tax=Candidatus Nealsoniibacteriota TaxID=1817911 RepID=A0A2M7UYN6_9BACT|nr:MAG: hypothetical protein COX36_03335 [Candidatus Nealsonbacteria bacterium CG23_combo_of_CG06-09_8_20_14_all_38_19]PIZ89094.1 MAG: hypothetical protein COX90_01110 [Candidatus Nealsonbacteria bacterium CG_4_10_14_0_2_um_filter_38_17]
MKNQKTRWGSCFKKGNPNFNYKIALLSQRLADYIVVHELCHLGELNHSQKSWNLVAKAVPDYPEIRDELKNCHQNQSVRGRFLDSSLNPFFIILVGIHGRGRLEKYILFLHK